MNGTRTQRDLAAEQQRNQDRREDAEDASANERKPPNAVSIHGAGAAAGNAGDR
jgi:hypothetical protein